MSDNRIYVEGGGDSKYLNARCREGFHKLLEKSGLHGRVPRIVACGGRKETYDDFKTAHTHAEDAYIAMIVDSEDPVADINQTWSHLKARVEDSWNCPPGATDEQVMLMTTCMETWIVADHEALKRHYKKLQASALPSLVDLEQRNRHDVQDRLARATRDCTNAYQKGKRSFEALAELNSKRWQS